jgi:hypothetical protein
MARWLPTELPYPAIGGTAHSLERAEATGRDRAFAYSSSWPSMSNRFQGARSSEPVGVVRFMVGGREGTGHPATAASTRLMLFRTRGCLLALSLEAVEGVFELVLDSGGSRARLSDGSSVPLVDWSSLTGVPVAEGDAVPAEVAVVSTTGGLVGLPIERCLGARRVSLTAAWPVPTLLVDGRGSPACLLLRIEGRPVFLLEPRVLGGAARLETRKVANAPAGGAPSAVPGGTSRDGDAAITAVGA